MQYLYLIGTFVNLLFHCTEGARIIFLMAYPSQSHFNVIQPLISGLTKKNHNVTVVSSYRLGEKIDYYSEIKVPAFDFWGKVQEELGTQDMFETSKASTTSTRKALRSAGALLCDHFFEHLKLQGIINSANDFPYDLVVVDLFHTEALLILGDIFQKPIITISSSNFEHYMTNLVDFMVPSACSPIDYDTYTKESSFYERISNIYECIERRNQRQKDLEELEKVAQKHFPKTKSTSQLSEISGKVTLTLLNNHPPLLTSRPILRNMIPVGGLHVKPAQAIQWNIKRFLDDARNGAIYFSMGTSLKCSNIPQHKLNDLIAVFGRQKFGILWHCDRDDFENLPKNILVQKIISSADVLRHPHIKYFITSGGLLSLQETLMRYVPILGLPVFRDQLHNMKAIENLQIGVRLDFFNLTESSLTWALEELVNNPIYVVKGQEVAAIYRDRLMGATQTSLFWIDHILRHKDLTHLQTVGTSISWYQLYLFDLLALVLISAVCILVLGYSVYRLRLFLRKRHEQNKFYDKLR